MEPQNQNKELEGWKETLYLLEKISQKIKNYQGNSKPEIKAI